MAQEKKRVLGEIASFQIAWIARMLTGEKVDPRDINPYGQPRQWMPRSQEEQRIRNVRFFKVLDIFCEQAAKGR